MNKTNDIEDLRNFLFFKRKFLNLKQISKELEMDNSILNNFLGKLQTKKFEDKTHFDKILEFANSIGYKAETAKQAALLQVEILQKELDLLREKLKN